MKKKIVNFIFCMLLIVAAVFTLTGEYYKSKTEDFTVDINPVDYPLPPPIHVDMVLEKSICRRMSIRSYTSEQVTDEELSTILWAAYGYTENNNRSIFSPDGGYSTIIYVIRGDATYKYVPETHSLSLFKAGNYLYIGQCDDAPIKFGLVWNMSTTNDELMGMSEIGMIGQNIYFDANALNLGTVTNGAGVGELNDLGIPSNEKPEIIMPLGHPSTPYGFTYSPLPSPNLPIIVNNTYSLEDSINNRLISNRWDIMPLSDVEESQLIWSSYGYSYLLDNTNNRHRTLPSALAVYPFKIYAANQAGVYLYNPNTHSITTIVQEDRREEINNSIGTNDIWTATATWIIIPFYNTNSYPEYLTWWYYEVGAISHNVILEATALNLSINIITDISDINGLRSALGISSQTNLQPWFVIPAGHPVINENNSPPEAPNISGPSSGEVGNKYNYKISTTDPEGNNISYFVDWGDETNSGWVGLYASGEIITINHTWFRKGTYIIKTKAKDEHGSESGWSPVLTVTITENQPPDKPSINYNKNTDELVITAIDPDSDRVRFGVSWDNDNTVDQWTGFVASGTGQRINCGGRQGTVGVITEDEHGAQSDWVSVTSKSRKYYSSFFERLFYHFPIFEKILNQM
jgi:nitroreductase